MSLASPFLSSWSYSSVLPYWTWSWCCYLKISSRDSDTDDTHSHIELRSLCLCLIAYGYAMPMLWPMLEDGYVDPGVTTSSAFASSGSAY